MSVVSTLAKQIVGSSRFRFSVPQQRCFKKYLMAKFDFKKGSRKCHESERQFEPGDEYYSVLIESDKGSPERRDFSAELWKGPPESCIGWWRCQIPELGEGRVYWAPRNVLVAYFKHVLNDSSTTDIAYVTALLLSQKRILRVLDNRGDETILRLRDNEKQTYNVPVPEIPPHRLVEIQDELSERLFMDQPAELHSDDSLAVEDEE